MEFTVLCNGVYVGSVQDWLYVMEQFDNKTDANEKKQYLHALACTTKHKLIDVRRIIYSSEFIVFCCFCFT